LVVSGVEFSVLLSDRFSTRERDDDNHLMGVWIGFTVGMDEGKSESLLLLGIDNRFFTHRAPSLIPGITLSVKVQQ